MVKEAADDGISIFSEDTVDDGSSSYAIVK
jgi:hypothetical protein